MTITADEDQRAATDDRFFTAEDPAELAPGAHQDTPPPDGPDAPYGWMRDTKTGQWRPKKSAGRPKNAPPPGPDEVAAAPPITPPGDLPPPDEPAKRPAPTDADVPMPKGGVIAKRVDRLYRRAGRFLRVLDDDMGLALIECTRPDPDDPDAPTVGQAWEALAVDNPRIRAWLLNLVRGGNWQDLVMAHAPIAMALFTKEWVRRLIPGLTIERVAEVLLEPDEDTEPTDLTPEDAGDMQRTAEAMAQRVASKMGVRVPPNVAAAAMRQAEAMAAAREAPEAFRRHQPARGGSRSKRRAGR